VIKILSVTMLPFFPQVWSFEHHHDTKLATKTEYMTAHSNVCFLLVEKKAIDI